MSTMQTTLTKPWETDPIVISESDRVCWAALRRRIRAEKVFTPGERQAAIQGFRQAVNSVTAFLSTHNSAEVTKLLREAAVLDRTPVQVVHYLLHQTEVDLNQLIELLYQDAQEVVKRF